MFGSAPLALEDVMEVIKTGLFYRDLDIAENMLTTFSVVIKVAENYFSYMYRSRPVCLWCSYSGDCTKSFS